MSINQATTAAQRPTPPPVEVAGVRVINCNGCHVNKPETEFSFKSKATGKRNTKCKPCMRTYAQAHYRANQPARIAAAKQRNAAVRTQTRTKVATLLAETACTACGQAGSRTNDLIVVLAGDETTGGLRLSRLIRRGWAPARILALVAEAAASGSVLCRVCLGKRCGAQNRQSKAARARAAAGGAYRPEGPPSAEAGVFGSSFLRVMAQPPRPVPDDGQR